mgnify:CR=1 FL=1
MLKYLTKEDLPESLIDIEEVIGLDNVKEFIKLAGGSSVYIPSENSVLKPIRNKIIRKSFNGNYKELSRKFGISEVQVRNIINSNITY